MVIRILSLILLMTFAACERKEQPSLMPGTYGYDADFLKKYSQKIVELTDKTGAARILLSADYQGRVMTSSTNGADGTSFGWINYKLISSKKKLKQFNPVGGEERFWLGPEGGQYSIYFAPGDSFKISHWQVPALIDTIPFELVRHNNTEAQFHKDASFANYAGTTFTLSIDRSIKLLDRAALETKLNTTLPSSVRSVAYETVNKVTNRGEADWRRDTGLLSIWLLGMMTPSENTIAIIPFRPNPEAQKFITSNYFGEVPSDRLKIQDSVLYFTCDGKYRSKIGLSPIIAKPIAASFDFKKNVLTLVIFSVDPNAGYVNSKWEIQDEPFKGDVVNSYNDGPLADGNQLGPFYELESSSPALALRKNEAAAYRQTTCHFEGDQASLFILARQILGVDLAQQQK